MVARRVEGVEIERVADEILVLKEGSLEAHAINQSAAAVYDLCDGNTSKVEMAGEIHRRTGLPVDEEIVDLALSELVETGLVMLDGPESRFAGTRRALNSAVGAIVHIGVDAPRCRNRFGTGGGGGSITYSVTHTNTLVVRSSCRRFLTRVERRWAGSFTEYGNTWRGSTDTASAMHRLETSGFVHNPTLDYALALTNALLCDRSRRVDRPCARMVRCVGSKPRRHLGVLASLRGRRHRGARLRSDRRGAHSLVTAASRRCLPSNVMGRPSRAQVDRPALSPSQRRGAWPCRSADTRDRLQACADWPFEPACSSQHR